MEAPRRSFTIILIAILSVIIGMAIPNRWRIGHEDYSKGSPVGPRIIESVEGPALFQAYCAACHGKEGKGDGPAAVTFRATVPDLSQISERNSGTFPDDRIRKIISGEDTSILAHGTRRMPVWGPIFQQIAWDQGLDRLCIANLTKHVESLQTK